MITAISQSLRVTIYSVSANKTKETDKQGNVKESFHVKYISLQTGSVLLKSLLQVFYYATQGAKLKKDLELALTEQFSDVTVLQF